MNSNLPLYHCLTKSQRSLFMGIIVKRKKRSNYGFNGEKSNKYKCEDISY